MQQLRAFYIHLAVSVGSLLIIFVVNLTINVAAGIAGEWWAWWSVWAFIGCALGLAVHGLVLRLSRPRNSVSTWEEQQISKMLSAESA